MERGRGGGESMIDLGQRRRHGFRSVCLSGCLWMKRETQLVSSFEIINILLIVV